MFLVTPNTTELIRFLPRFVLPVLSPCRVDSNRFKNLHTANVNCRGQNYLHTGTYVNECFILHSIVPISLCIRWLRKCSFIRVPAFSDAPQEDEKKKRPPFFLHAVFAVK